MKLLFVNPLDRAMDLPRDVPFDLLSVATVADKLGHKADLLDLNAYREGNTTQGIKDVFKADTWDVIWASASFTQLKEALDTIAVARPLQETAAMVMGGRATTLMAEQVVRMCPELDIAVTGDQEGVFEDVLDYVTSQRWSAIRGITYRQEGQVHTNPPHMPAELDKLPLLNYSFIPLPRYFAASPLPFSQETMQAKRRLSFSWAREYFDGPKRTIVVPSPARAVESIDAARKRQAIDFALLADREITVNGAWFVEFLAKYMDEDLQDIVSWGCTMDVGVAAANVELIRMMKEAGCKYIHLILREAEQMRQWQGAVDSVRRNGVAPVLEMMYGYPNDSMDTMASRAYFLFKNGMDATVRPLVPYPDTPYFREHQKKILDCYAGAEDPLAAFLTDVGGVKAANVSPFDVVDKMGYGVLITAKDYGKILEVAHGRRRGHAKELDEICPVHKGMVEVRTTDA